MLYNLLRIFLYPLLRFVLPFFSLKAKNRLLLELENTNDQLDIEYIFHISSEGELEQSLSLIEHYLLSNRVLVLFTSDSVLDKLKKLQLLNPNLFIEAKRTVTYFPFFNNGIYKYKGIKTFFMVRYDFFPELIYFSYQNTSILLNASLLNKSDLGFINKKYLKFCLMSFNKIVYASKAEISRFENLDISRPYFCFDLRSLRILKRKEFAVQTLGKFPFIQTLNQENRKKIILGSYWDDEFINIQPAILNSLKGNDLIALAPHKFSDIPKIVQTLKKSDIDSIIVSKDSELFVGSLEGKVIIFNVPGILCELYSIFDHAHVGGGWHKSIHSVLEPFLMNDSIVVSCGDNINRSSEYELIKDIDPTRVISFSKRVDLFETLDSDSKPMYHNFEKEFINLKSFINNE